MRPGAPQRPAARRDRVALATVLTATVLTATGCAGEPPAAPVPTAPAVPPPADARVELAARAAAAQDRAFTASYTLAQPGRAERTVAVTMAADRTWRIDIPAGALGGTADVAVAQMPAGIFQCSLPSAVDPRAAICVRVAKSGGRVPDRFDPQVQHPFTDWRDVMTDRQAALSVTPSRPLRRSRGDCYAVESTSASLTAPLDVGIYCFTPDGLLTAARVGFGTLTLAGEPAAAPPSIDLPGPVVAGEPLSMAAPPPPPPEPSGSASAGAAE
jgi:hypothetical protein